MIEKIIKTIKNYSIIKKGEALLLCVSGGHDSMAMLYAFHAIAKEMKLRLFIAHLNHSLRGTESDKDQLYVEGVARKLNLPVVSCKKNTLEVSKKCKISIETAARKIRYDFFISTAKKLRIKSVATAHTRDDQAETMLMRIIRGTGLRGLCGIQVKKDIDGISIIRPMIEVSRKEILSYISSCKIKPRVDESNRDIKFFRNKIRIKLLPVIEKQYNPDIRNVLSSLASVVQGDYDYLESDYKRIFKKQAKIISGRKIAFRLCDIKSSHVALRRGLIRSAIKFLKNNLNNIEYRHWKEIDSLINERPSGSKVNIPDNIIVEKRSQSLYIAAGETSKKNIKLKPAYVFKAPSSIVFGKYRFRITRVKDVPEFSRKPKYTEYLNIKKTYFPLVLRGFNEGDRIKPLGMHGYKKLSDMFIDDKIPASRRKSIPVLASARGEVLCVFGVRISGECKISKNTENAFKLELLTR